MLGPVLLEAGSPIIVSNLTPSHNKYAFQITCNAAVLPESRDILIQLTQNAH